MTTTRPARGDTRHEDEMSDYEMILCPACHHSDIELTPTFQDPDPADVHCRCLSCGHEWDTVEPSWDDDDTAALRDDAAVTP